MLSFESKGSFRNTETWLKRMSNLQIESVLHKYGQEGVSALSSATPTESGVTGASWSYRITKNKGYSIEWTNSNVAGGTPVVILLQYGHATGTGGYVQGRDFINPAIQPIFDRIADEVWKVVTS